MALNNQSSGGGGWKSGGNGGGNSPWGQGGGGGGGGGPWGSGGGGGGGGPWGSGGGGGGKDPPDLEDILKRGQDRVKQVMDGGGLPGPLLLLAGAALTAFVAWHAFFFRVNADEIGAVLRFGEFSRQAGPGLHSRLPYPIDEVRTIKVTDQKIMDITTKPANAAQSNTKEMMLTADENIVDVRFNVLWRIKLDENSIKLYLFNIQNPEQTVREVAESVMREVVGQTPLQPLLTEARLEVQKNVQQRMQTILDQYGAGVRIDQVQLREVDPPSSVIASFRDVQAAAQERETKIKEAQKYADQIITVTKGEADRIKAIAQGYKDQTVAEATGQAARFIKVYDEYKKAPEVTRQRLYLETMERVLGGADKFIIDQRQGGQGVVPYLPLNELANTKKKSGSN
ncbi:MAG: FtsH protease activity modulator HflK [Hyphomicrobiaceae bacterium]|nr:FtsH protease activity modulator HflK [Hyphomicrobiaceae bacterium]